MNIVECLDGKLYLDIKGNFFYLNLYRPLVFLTITFNTYIPEDDI